MAREILCHTSVPAQSDPATRDHHRPFDWSAARCQHHGIHNHRQSPRESVFLEELTHAVIEHGDLQRDVVVPDTIQGVLSARIDRLPEAQKHLLQTASVLGREFAPRLLQALWEETTPLASLLLDLKRLEFLYERARGEEPVYVFKHALTQDVAYGSLLTTRRQVLHAAAGHALERLYPDWLVERSENWRITTPKSGLTGRRSTIGITLGKKLSSVQRMWKPSVTSPKGWSCSRRCLKHERFQREVDMLIALGASLRAMKGTGALEVGETYRRARHLCQHLEDPHQLFPVLHGLWNYYFVRAELQTAHTLGEQLLTLAQQVQDAAMLVAAHRAIRDDVVLPGHSRLSAHTLYAGVALYDPQQHRTSAFLYVQDIGVSCRSYAALTLWFLGYPAQGLTRSQRR